MPLKHKELIKRLSRLERDNWHLISAQRICTEQNLSLEECAASVKEQLDEANAELAKIQSECKHSSVERMPNSMISCFDCGALL